jgi:hypothetical protein
VFDFFAFSCAGQNLAARPIWCPRRERVTAPREAVATTIERTHRLYALVEELRVTAPRGVPILVTPVRRLHDRPPLAEAIFAERCCPLSRNDLLAPNVPNRAGVIGLGG